ncbi:sigma-54-dependent Fis family transcriptional regulator [bacterium]|nr:sigma-54-dependent Fis family transcriptional regulator [bacterium]
MQTLTQGARILIADDQLNMRKILQAILEKEGYEVSVAADGCEVIEFLTKDVYQTIITDLKMPGLDGLEVLERVSEVYPRLPVIMITAHGTIETAVVAMKKGAIDYITKPFEKDEIVQAVQKAVSTFRLSEQEVSDEVVYPGRYALIGQSKQMQEIYAIIDKVAASPTTILILGESGTGKELVAKAIHAHSLVKNKPFIKINCAAIPENLLESELFGYEKGAFTGAVTSKPGRFELAEGGTLFLDEIGEIPKEMQVKLLRCLQEQEFERVGGLKTIKMNVRLLAATNSDLEVEVQKGKFRQDLFYRLNVVPIRLPSLRERIDDIPFLIDYFLQKFNTKLGKQVVGFEDDARNMLMNYNWPGNIRELENVMERCILLSEGPKIIASELPQLLSRNGRDPIETDHDDGTVPSLKEAVKKHTQRVERGLIIRMLQETGGNITKAANLLGISRKSLQTKMKEYNLRERDEREE